MDRRSSALMSASLRLEVLLARIAPGFATASSFANSARLASRFSKIASMMTSAWRAPSPVTSGIRRSVASRMRALSRRRRLNSSCARFIAGARRSAFWSCSVTVRPRIAHRGDVAAHDAGADHVHVLRLEIAVSLPSAFMRSCRKKMRIRFRAVSPSTSVAIDAGVAARRRERVAVVLLPQLEDRVGRRVVLAAGAPRDLFARHARRRSAQRRRSASAIA